MARPDGSAAPRGIDIDPDDPAARAFLAFYRLLRRYHRHRVSGLERVERLMADGQRIVLVANHALDVVDPLLFCAALFERTGRAPHFIGHARGWFEVPGLRAISQRFGVIPARRLEETVDALRRDGLLMLYPGGNREAAMRSYRDEPYRLRWQDRTGFLRVALEAEAQLVFVAAVGTDEAYYQSALPTPSGLTRWLDEDSGRYDGARLGFGLAGPHLVPGLFPLPVRITHTVSEPLELGDRERARRDPRALAALHAEISERCQKLLDAAVARREDDADVVDRAVRGVQGWLQRVGL